MIHSIVRRAMPIIFWSAGLFIAFVVLLVLGALSSQHRRDREYEAKLRPSIAFVESFRRANYRLPSDAEFEDRMGAPSEHGIDLLQFDSAEPAFKSHGGGKTKGDFAVRVWRGEQWTYYFSWNRQFDIVEP